MTEPSLEPPDRLEQWIATAVTGEDPTWCLPCFQAVCLGRQSAAYGSLLRAFELAVIGAGNNRLDPVTAVAQVPRATRASSSQNSMYEGNVMTPARGFFSVIQFCPDLDRGEYANVGVVLVVPQSGVLEIRMSEDNEGPKQRFRSDSFDDTRLSIAKKGLAGRIREEGQSWSSAEDLLRFGQKEGNNLTLSPPRVILAESASAEADELYARLVHVESVRRRRLAAPNLAAVFESRLIGVPLIKDHKVEIPEYGTWKVPYAYHNGALNLIRPEAFSESSAEDKGNDLAVKGHLIRRHSEAIGKPQKLIVVGGFDPSAPESLKRRIEFILQECDARLVREESLDEFVEEIRREAHS